MTPELNEIITTYANLCSKVYAATKMLNEVQLEIMALMGNKIGLSHEQSEMLLKSIKEGLE